MTTRRQKIIAGGILALCLTLLGVALGVRWFVESGRLRTLIEVRAAESLSANVEMKSLKFAWPWRVEIEDLRISAVGHEESPLLTCPKLTLTAPIWDLVNGHLSSVVMVGPKINIVTGDGGASNIPGLPRGETSDGGLSVGTIKVIDADVSLDSPAATADLKGILATLSARHTLGGREKVLRLNIDAATASVGRDTEKRIPLSLKLLQSKFVIRDGAPGHEIEAEIHAAINAELPHLVLPPDLPAQLNFEFGYSPEKDFLENGIFVIEIARSIRVRAYGSVENLTGGTPVANLNLTVPALDFKTVAEYIELLQRPTYEDMEIAGSVRISGELKGAFSEPDLSLRVNVAKGKFGWKGLALEEVQAELPIAFGAGGLEMGPGRVSAARVLVPVGEGSLEVQSLSGQISGDPSRVNASEFACKLGEAGDLSLQGSYETASGRLSAEARIETSSIGDLMAYASPVAEKLPADLSADGKLTLDLDIEAALGSKPQELGVEYSVALREGEFTHGESFAAEGVEANLAGSIGTGAPDKLWRFSVAGDVGNFQVLVDTFYADLSANRFPVSFSGEYDMEKSQIQNAAASVDLGETGKIAADGGVQFSSTPEIELDLNFERIDLGKFMDEIGAELLSELVPALDGAEVGGIASGDVSLLSSGERLQAQGALALADGRIALAGGSLVMDSVSVRLPFGVRFPQEDSTGPVTFAPDDFGKIRLGGIRAGPVSVSSLELDVALKENAISVKSPAPIDIFGGTVEVGAIEGENVLGSLVALRTSLSVRDISLGRVSADLGLPEVAGELNADYDMVALTVDSLTAEGAARANIFGGTIDIASVEIGKPFSSVRAVRADFVFKEIDLSMLTAALGFGSIRGIMEGTLYGLEMSQGQPAAFTADFQTVKRRGVRQRINFDAVENITILGTGQGFQAGMRRGLASFFDEFGYDSIGFECTLRNDNFRMKGKVIRGETEYFVKGVTLGPQINVINRSPGQTVSFKSMLERINRIKASEENEFE